jgi:hypothetical protein
MERVPEATADTVIVVLLIAAVTTATDAVEVSKFPSVPGATKVTFSVSLPITTLLRVSVANPVPPLATGKVVVDCHICAVPVIVVLDTVCDALTVYVPVPPVPVPRAVMVVPPVTPVPVSTCPIAIVPEVTAATVIVVVLIDALNTATSEAEARKFPTVPGATKATLSVPLPTTRLLRVRVASPVPPLVTGTVPVADVSEIASKSAPFQAATHLYPAGTVIPVVGPTPTSLMLCVLDVLLMTT